MATYAAGAGVAVSNVSYETSYRVVEMGRVVGIEE